MRRHLESIDLDCGTWLRLDCGHPAPTDLRPDGIATCALCDRAQLPTGLVPEGPPHRHRAPWDRHGYELAPTVWTILTVEAGAVDLACHGAPVRNLVAPARSVLVAGGSYRIAPSPVPSSPRNLCATRVPEPRPLERT